MKIPIVPRFYPSVVRSDLAQVSRLANQIKREQPQLNANSDSFRSLIVDGPIESRPTFHLDDFSEIPIIGKSNNSQILQQRARLRAGAGDWVAQSNSIERCFSDYCEFQLGLGQVNWLTPRTNDDHQRHVALACWQDRRTRHDLVQAIRNQGLRYLHPHISTLHVWELAALLSNATRMPLSVIGPTPALSRWVNDKIEFTNTVARLFGEKYIPHTESAFNFSMLAKIIFRLSDSNERIGIKFPYGTGGKGNFVIESSQIRGHKLTHIHSFLKSLLRHHRWPESGRVLVDVWRTKVIDSPSVQTWIPPYGHGDPKIEGLFSQNVVGTSGTFIGSHPAELPPLLTQSIINKSYLVAILFQRLGYVGRCSFDLILVGEDVHDCQPEFIECNGRWGGTSAPMTLMNRLTEVPGEQTYGIRKLNIEGLDRLEFSKLKRLLGEHLFDVSKRTGQFILFNPARIKRESAIDSIAIGKSTEEVDNRLTETLPNLLKQIVRKFSDHRSSLTGFLLNHAAFAPPHLREKYENPKPN